MELIDLQFFLTVVRERSFSRAAAALHMAQPSVSQRVAGLEARLGLRLFQRHGRGVTLTPEGRLFHEYAERALGLLDEGVQAARSASAESVLQIDLAAPASLCAYLLPAVVRALVGAGLNVTVTDGHSHQVVQQVMEGTIHAGFVLGVPTQPGLRRVEVTSDPVLCVCAPVHPLARLPQPTMADVGQHPLALYSFSSEASTLWEAISRAAGRPLRGVLKVAPAEAARALALSGEFATFLPAMTVQDLLADGRLVRLDVPGMPPFSWPVSLVYRVRKEAGPALDHLFDVLRQMGLTIGGR